MIRTLAELSLRSGITREQKTRNTQFLEWNDIRHIALILNSGDNINKSAMDKFIDGTGKLIDVYYVETRSKQPSYADWQCLSKKERSILGLPSEKVLQKLKEKKYDLAINTANDSDLYASALVTSLQSPFKCGAGRKFSQLDLVIKKADPYHVIDYLNEVIRYLKMIRT